MKRNLLLLFSLIIIIPLTSAAGIGDFLNTVDQSTLVLGCLFVIFFALANFSLGKFFKDRTTGQPNKGITSVVSFCVALLMIYGVNKSNLDYSGAVGSLGIQSDVLMIILAVLLAAGLIFLLIKLKTRALLFTGLFLIFLAYFAEALNVEFDKGKLLVTGGIILFLWILALVWTKRKNWGSSKKKGDSGNNNQQTQQQSTTQENPQQKIVRERVRTALDLKQKYLSYLFYYHRKGIGKHKRERIMEAMNAILNYISKIGMDTNDFLSNRIAGTNAKHVRQLKAPDDPSWND